ncbi:MAG: alpha/beta hydrolase-fold protein [Verrucomicrobiota bacterium]
MPLLRFLLGFLGLVAPLIAAESLEGFRWVNPLPKNADVALKHQTFRSTANKVDVGFVIALPAGYDEPANRGRRYPVLYWLHGGRPGGETKSLNMFPTLKRAQETGALPPVIIVFPNGGRLSHYDHGDAKGEQAFLELIKHVDATWRTIPTAAGRAVEGMSQGGRAVGRYAFKHPELFCSAVAISGGNQREKIISENKGRESDALTLEDPKNNVFDAATAYAARKDRPVFKLMVLVGDQDENMKGNVEWSAHLKRLGLEHVFITVPGVGHNALQIYGKVGPQILAFHAENLRKAAGGK